MSMILVLECLVYLLASQRGHPLLKHDGASCDHIEIFHVVTVLQCIFHVVTVLQCVTYLLYYKSSTHLYT